MRRIKKLVISMVGISLLLFSFVPADAVIADSVNPSAQSQIQQGINDANGGTPVATPEKSIQTTIGNIINILSAVVGIVAVIMIIIAGLRYATSGGDPEAAKGAKNTILYAVIGLVIVAVAQLIVHFVLHTVS